MKRCTILLVAVLLLGMGACAKAKVLPVDLIKVAVPAYPASLVPTRLEGDTARFVQTQLFETLYTQSNSIFKPLLAQALPVFDAGGIRCVIKIAPGIPFHDGSIFSVQDAVYSINHLIEAKSTPMTLSIKSAVVVDDTSFAINLNYPDGELKTKLAHPMFAMIKADSDADAKLEKSPNGTGPYKFVSADGKNNVVLTRFDNYHGDKALTKDVQFAVYADINNALTALRDKQVNLVTDVPLNAKKTVEGLKGFSWFTGQTSATVYLGIRNQSMLNSKLETSAFRKAVMSSIDRSALASDLDANVMVSLYGMNVFGYDEQPPSFINGASITGYADQAITLVSPVFPVDFDVAAAVSSRLKQSGFTNLTNEALAQDKFQAAVATAKRFDLMIFVWQYDLMDGGNFIDALFGADSVNPLRVRNTDLDSLILTANRTDDSAIRRAALDEIERILIADGTLLPLTSVMNYVAAGEKIKEISLLPDATINLGKIVLAK
ncbi:MAG: ABC transporter substrate-binding protein [Erysipelotrichaceae bacterium]